MKIYKQNALCLSLTFVMLASAIASAATIDIGASYDQVVRELGEPDGKLVLGKKQILTYGDAKVTLRDDAVTEISPEFESLLEERSEKQKEIQEKRDANLVNFRGEWMTPEAKKRIITAESKIRAQNRTAQAIWLTDFRQALELAKYENKKILLNFTGSDWCGWCIKLENEVFSQPEFKQFAQENYVLVKVDFPKKKKLSAALKKQNDALASKYKIKGFPSIVVLTPSGKLYARGVYVKGGPNAFLRSIL